MSPKPHAIDIEPVRSRFMLTRRKNPGSIGPGFNMRTS